MSSETFEEASPFGRSGRGRRRPRGEVTTSELPPHSIEAEQGAISCVMQDNTAAMDEAEERNVSIDWFYDLRHQTIWSAILQLRTAGKNFDIIVLSQWLRDHGMLEQVGGLGYLAELPDMVPSPAMAPHYFGILREQMMLREIIKAGTDAVQSALSITKGEKTNPEDLVARLERQIGKLSEQTSAVAEVRIGQIVAELMPELENYHRGTPQLRGVTTGLSYLDKLLCGIGGRNGNYIVISGRPSMGKTSLAMQIAEHAALDFVWWDPRLQPRDGGGPPIPVCDPQTGVPLCDRRVGIPVAVFSYEMASDALVTRMLFSRARADLQRWRTGFAETSDIESLMTGSRELADAKIFIDDQPGPVESMRARARRMVRTYGIKCFVIDYLQLMTTSVRRLQDRVQELAEVSRVIRELAKELNIPFVVLAQMNRDYEKDPTRAPRLSDLKDCGAIEQDADVVTFLYSPKLKERDKDQYDAAMDAAYPEGDWSKRPIRVNALVAKNRYGPSGKAELLFQKSCTRFHDWIEWLKDHGQRNLAAGESRRAVESGAQPGGNTEPGRSDREGEPNLEAEDSGEGRALWPD